VGSLKFTGQAISGNILTSVLFFPNERKESHLVVSEMKESAVCAEVIRL
jgi:hypothetical protein